MRVLVVEDEPHLRSSIVAWLKARGFGVDAVGDLDDAEFQMDVNTYDCLVLDRALPSGDALDLLTVRRRDGYEVPALFLTARGAVEDRVAGFEAGGDDYLVKPFAMDELVARVRSLCRRAVTPRPPVLRVGDLEVDIARHEVRRGGVLITLTGKEFAVLELLASAGKAVVTRADLAEHCWDDDADPMSNVIDVNISTLRRKLGTPRLIHTVRGAGYLLDDEPPPR